MEYEEEEIQPTQEYIDNFNKGYIIGKFMPEIAEELFKAKGTSEKLEALKEGQLQYKEEAFQDKLPSYLKDDPFKSSTTSKDNSRQKGFDIDKGEREK